LIFISSSAHLSSSCSDTKPSYRVCGNRENRIYNSKYYV